MWSGSGPLLRTRGAACRAAGPVAGRAVDRSRRSRWARGRPAEADSSAWSAPQVLVEEVSDDAQQSGRGPQPGLPTIERQVPMPGTGENVACAGRAGGAQRAMQLRGLVGRDDAVVVAVQQQEWRGGRMDEVGRVGCNGAVA